MPTPDDPKNQAQMDPPDPIRDAVWSLINDAKNPEAVGETRKEVVKLFGELSKTPEVRRVMLKKLVEDLVLDDQLVTQLEALNSDGFLDSKGGTQTGDVPPPALPEVIASFGIEGLQRARALRDPFLLLVPITAADHMNAATGGPAWREILGWTAQFAERSDAEKIRMRDTPPNAIGGDMIAGELPPGRREALMGLLRFRFEANPDRHPGIAWDEVSRALSADPKAVFSLHLMEGTGGEPDVLEATEDSFVFCDFSAESPAGRRDLNYYAAAIQAKSFGAELMDEVQYRHLQEWEHFDNRSWSWIKTPKNNLEAGNALHGLRFGEVVRVGEDNAVIRFGNRGWRAALRVKKLKL